MKKKNTRQLKNHENSPHAIGLMPSEGRYQPTLKPMIDHVKMVPGKFSCFLLSVDFFKINSLEKFFQEYHLSVKQIGSRSGQMLVGPELGPNCLQRLIQQTILVGNDLNTDVMLQN